MSTWGQIVSEIVAQLYSENSIQTLLIFFWVDPMAPVHKGILKSEPSPPDWSPLGVKFQISDKPTCWHHMGVKSPLPPLGD